MPSDPHDEQKLFLRLVALPPVDRPAALDQACGSDVALRQRVAGLLKDHEDSESPQDEPSDQFGATVLSDPENATHTNTAEDPAEDRPQRSGSTRSGSPEAADTSIRDESIAGAVIADRYTMVRQIGEGGMGEVWVANQTSPVKRKVAVKLIKMGMDSKAVLARFDQERQALALMEHPNIAQVLDGGITPTGQPFFVMELVNGLPLTQFCDEARLDTKGRLELFVAICQAVQHAHQKGIVHRDLKPANILVTLVDGRPVPKVIDFGVAKATTGKLTDESLSTQFGAVVGTLEYMSPEQAGFSGEDIDTRADIYSLGVILYELLTGLRPIDAQRLQKAALTELIRIIREEEPSRPSTRLSTHESLPSTAAVRQIEPRKLTAMLKGELDWVVMKCLEKSRDRRYETANGLARDIQRFLSGETVEARPASTGYRLSKFLSRNKGPLLAAGLLLLSLVGGLAGTLYGLFEAQQAVENERIAKNDAVEKQNTAEIERSRADKNAADYLAAKQLAENRTEKLAESEARLVASNEQLKQALYLSNIQLAFREWQAGDVVTALQYWNACDQPLRNWEHQYLGRLFRRGQWTFKSEGKYPLAKVSPDGQRVIEVSEGKSVLIRNAETGKLISKIQPGDETLFSADFNPIGGTFLTSGSDNAIRIWNCESNELVQTIKLTEECYRPVFDPQGKLIAGTAGGKVFIWNATTGNVELEVTDDRLAGCRTVAFSSDGKNFVTGHFQSTVIVWDAETGKSVRDLEGHSFMVHTVACSHQNHLIVSGGADQTARLWELQTGKPLHVLPNQGRVMSVTFSPDDRIVACACDDKTVTIWDVESGDLLRTLKGHTAGVSSVDFSPNGQLFSSAGDQSIRRWDFSDEKELTIQVVEGISPITIDSLVFSEDDSELLAGVGDTEQPIRRLDVETGAAVVKLPGIDTNSVGSFIISPDGKYFVWAFQDNTLLILDCVNGKQIRTLAGHGDMIFKLAFSQGSSRLLSCGRDKTTILWNVETGEQLLSLKLEFDPSAIALSDDGQRVVIGNHQSIQTYNADNAQPLWQQKASLVSALAFDKQSARIVAGNYRGQLSFLNAETGELEKTVQGHSDQISTIVFHPDGSRFATGSMDKTIRVWDAQNAVPAITLRGHSAEVRALSFDHQGDRLASASRDQTVKVWDASTPP